jgi:hypothetical protein
MSRSAPEGQGYSFDEYYESTEKVTDRRLATNTWNYSLCTAIMLAVAGLASWASSRLEFRLVMLLAILVVAGMGALLCSLWAGQIRDFKELNAAKFEVLNWMAPSVRFGDDAAIVSAIPFAREWDMMQAKQATREMQSMRIIALRSSNAEFLVPAAFRSLFILILLAVGVTMGVNWTPLTHSVFDFRPPASASAQGGTVARP